MARVCYSFGMDLILDRCMYIVLDGEQIIIDLRESTEIGMCMGDRAIEETMLGRHKTKAP
jgi:hypothetical protein